MFKRSFFLVVIFGLFVLTSSAQLVNDLYKLYDPSYYSLAGNDSSVFVQPGKTHFNFSFGTGYTSLGHGMGFSNSYFSPSVAYSPNEKFQIIAGASISYNSYRNMTVINSSSSDTKNQLNSGNPAQAYAYGRYQATNKLSIFAMGSYSKNQLYISPYQSGVGKVDYGQFGVGFNYKFNEKTSVGASFNFSNAPYSFGINSGGGLGNFGFPY